MCSQHENKFLGFYLGPEPEKTFKCYRCPETRCMDLFDHNVKYENIGHEFYIYKLLGMKIYEKYDDLNKYACRNGELLRATCFLVNPVLKEKESYLKEVLYQSGKDLKASTFLAFSGHYRQAMQVLRCSFENLISGIYFHSDLCELREKGAAREEFERLERRFNEWKRSGRVSSIRANIEALRRIHFLARSEEQEWKDLYGNLSKFVHTPEEYICHVSHKDVPPMWCIASTYFSEDALRTWSDSFQKVFWAILKTVVEYHPFALETESGKLAIRNLRGLQKKYGTENDSEWNEAIQRFLKI